jgi:cellulose synthase/poly-beta-1,6-N-acetylglucosamine synthase-like glycosyltransferase
MTGPEIAFWICVGLLLHTHLGYPLTMALAARLWHRPPAERGWEPSVSLILACHNEQDVIAERIRNVLALDYPADRLEVIVASDGSIDRTAALAREAGDGRVVALELPRGGKVSAQDAGAERASGEVLAFGDANASWEPDALRRLVAPLADSDVAYVCGEVAFTDPAGDNQEGLYWRVENALRQAESDAGSITAGNGAIYAVRASDYLSADPRVSHDLSLPFNLVKRGRRAVFAPEARASEAMVPDLGGEFRRKRRMMGRVWPLLLRGGMLSPRGYSPLYAFQITSHRALRYASPFLHAAALVLNVALLAAGGGLVYVITLAVQLGLLAAALLARVVPLRPLQIARYYLLVTAAPALGLWDWMLGRVGPTWEHAEGTR